jgi:hypothetical protein
MDHTTEVYRIIKHSSRPNDKKLSRSKLDRLEYTPEYIVYPGDKIYIAQETSIYPADRKMRDLVQEDSVALVFLEVSRTDGTVVRVETSLRLF